MENITEILISTGIAVVTVIAGWLMSNLHRLTKRFKERTWKAIEENVDDNLKKNLKGVLVNVFQTRIKGIYKTDAWTPEKKQEVFNIAFDNFVTLLPDFILKSLKRFKKNWDVYLKQKIQQFLEENKTKINVSNYVN